MNCRANPRDFFTDKLQAHEAKYRINILYTYLLVSGELQEKRIRKLHKEAPPVYYSGKYDSELPAYSP